eukprot:814906_1
MSNKEITSDDSVPKEHSGSSIANNSSRIAKAEAMELKTITAKQTTLATAALASSLLFYIYGIATQTPDFMGFDVIVNTLSIHLMFSYSKCMFNP